MNDAQIIQSLDGLEADLRAIELRIFRVRSALRDRIDPSHRRDDLGYWPDADAALSGREGDE